MNARATKRPDDGPLLAEIKRVRKGCYAVTIILPFSRKLYHDELVLASSVKDVRKRIEQQWPTLKWSKKK